MLASTMQFSNTNQKHPPPQNHLPPTPPHVTCGGVWERFGPGRCLTFVSIQNQHHTGVASGPNSVPTQQSLPVNLRCWLPQCKEREQSLRCPSETPAATTGHPQRAALFECGEPVLLLRKEVIQPHLPVRLPCYDFVPIASPTFDHSPPYGLGHGLRVLPTFVT